MRTDLLPGPRRADAGARRTTCARDCASSGSARSSGRCWLWSPCANLAINALFIAATLRLIQAGFPAWQIGLVETVAGVCGILGALAAPRLIARFAHGSAHRRGGLELRAAAPSP